MNPIDATEDFKEHDRKVMVGVFYGPFSEDDLRREKRRLKKGWFNHRSRGKIWQDFITNVTEIFKYCEGIDYKFNGEDEYPVATFNKELAAKRIAKLIFKKKLLKHLL